MSEHESREPSPDEIQGEDPQVSPIPPEGQQDESADPEESRSSEQAG